MTEHTEIPEFLPAGIYDFTVDDVREKESPEGSPIIELQLSLNQQTLNLNKKGVN
jgi:hypothetical protein